MIDTSKTTFYFSENDVSSLLLSTSVASTQAFYNAGLMNSAGPQDYGWPENHVPYKIVFGTELSSIDMRCIENGQNTAGVNVHELVVPTSITAIDQYAFVGTGLSSVTFTGRSMQDIMTLDQSENSFGLPDGCVIYYNGGSHVVGQSGNSGGSGL